MIDETAYAELYCVGANALARRVSTYRRHGFQAVLFLPSPNAGRSGRDQHDHARMFLKAVGLYQPQELDRLRYSRILLCQAGNGRATDWMEALLRRRGPHLFLQNRVFKVQLPPRRAPTYEEWCAAVGNAVPMSLSLETASRF